MPTKIKCIIVKSWEKRGIKIKQEIDDILQEAKKIEKQEDELYGETPPPHYWQTLNWWNEKRIEKQLKKINTRKETLKRKKKILKAKQKDI